MKKMKLAGILILAILITSCSLFKKTSKFSVKQGATIEDYSKVNTNYSEDKKTSQNEDLLKITEENDSSNFDITLIGNVRINKDGSLSADSAKIKGNKKSNKKGSENKKTENLSSESKKLEQDSTGKRNGKETLKITDKESEPDDGLMIKIYITTFILALIIAIIIYKKFKKP